jgi:hypothetical protein
MVADELVFGQHPMKENYHDSYASVRVFPDMLTRPGEGGKRILPKW